MEQKKIHKRGLTSFFTLFGFLIMSITGLVLYIVPQGRVAYWVHWSFLGLSKTDWDNIHILSSILFIVAGAFHIYFNWKPLINYFEQRATGSVKLKKELAISLAVAILVVFSALYSIPPLSYLIDLSAYAKEAWVVERDYEPPFGHAELLSLKGFSTKMDINLQEAIEELEKQNVEFESPEETLEEIAIRNDISPMDIYLLIKKYEVKPVEGKIYTADEVETEFAGMGIGNRTIGDISTNLNVDLYMIKERFEANGIDYTSGETLKKIAERHQLNPIDVLKVILVEDYSINK
ncbi:MAG: DUF4405 domain-containing protein [candidate division Zixibacteria bacterium]|nr:DUF4405 domain-containing protein [candidate division Zixibacteria bacterium]